MFNIIKNEKGDSLPQQFLLFVACQDTSSSILQLPIL